MHIFRWWWCCCCCCLFCCCSLSARERDAELNMRLTGGKQKLDYLLASIADYSAPLVFFITLFYCTNLMSSKRDSNFFEFVCSVLSGRARYYVDVILREILNCAQKLSHSFGLLVAYSLVRLFYSLIRSRARLTFFSLSSSACTQIHLLPFSARVAVFNLNRFESIFLLYRAIKTIFLLSLDYCLSKFDWKNILIGHISCFGFFFSKTLLLFLLK